MEKDIAILLEDDKEIRTGFENLFEDLGIEMELILCEKPEEYEEKMANPDIKNRLKVLIMDLSTLKREEETKVYKAAEFIEQEFSNNRIPIYIHSSNLHDYNEFEEKGTVFKKEKKKSSTAEICNDIKLLHDSGFLNLFSVGGDIETAIMNELHQAFITQFKNLEIKEIINSIINNTTGDSNNRVKEVFERIAIRSLYTNLMSAKSSKDNDSITEVKINSIEHYYRRTPSPEFWTGDVFKNIQDETMSIILTPRCNIGHNNYKELLICGISPISGEQIKVFLKPSAKSLELFKKHITDDKLVGDKCRFLPPSPQFSGGFVDFTTAVSINSDEFRESYTYLISLSDELTNDVSRKYASYMLRGGISETDFAESLYYLKD